MKIESTKASLPVDGIAFAKVLGWLGRSLGLVLVLLVCPLRSEAVSATVLVASVSGEVKALSIEDEFEVTLGKEFLGREISVNSVVTTGVDGAAALLFSNGVIVNLQSNSRLYLRKFVQVEFSTDEIDLADLEKEPSTSQLELHLDFGNLVVKAPKLAKGSSVRLTSPIGTAGIRGTIFQMVVVRDGETGAISGGVNLLSGELEFTDLSGDVTSLASGEGMQFTSNRLGAQVSAVAGEITDLINQFVFPASPWHRDVRLPGEDPLIPVEEPAEEEPPEPPPPMSIQEISSLIFFTLEEAEEAVSKLTVDMLENPVSVAAPLSTPSTPSPPAFATAIAGDLFVNQSPTISLVGTSVLEVDLSEPFIDPGVTALDFGGNDISGGVTVTGSVDVKVAGTYSLTYFVTDFRGFQSTVTRTVEVGDFTPPNITLIGDATISHEAGDVEFTDPGATAEDVLAGQTTDLTTDLVAKLTFDKETSSPGAYSIIYSATDAAGNEATATRTVTIVDTTSPEITLIAPFLGGEGFEPMLIDVDSLTTYVDVGATALDSFDGDLTVAIDVDDEAKTALNKGDKGDFTITYSVTDAAGNTVSASRYVVIIGNDNEGPTIRLAGKDSADPAHDPDPDNDGYDLDAAAQSTHEVGDTWEDYGYTAFKKQGNKTFDYTDDVKVSGFLNSGTLDTYTLTYTVKDEFQNTTIAIRTVTVVDTTAPILTLDGDATVEIEAPNAYTESGATATDSFEGDLSSEIVIGGDIVDVSTLGDYTLTYNISDASGNAATEVTRNVTVVDTTAPVLALVGDATVEIEAPTTYVESGATATDSFEDDLSSEVVVGGDTVDVSTLGDYTLTYNVTDTAGNAATQITRKVTVVDTTAPELTLDGDSEVTIIIGEAYTESGAAATDLFEGDVSSKIVVGGDTVDTLTLGEYTVTYEVTDTAGNVASLISRKVIVASKPTITLVGGDMEWEAGITFVEPGYEATDLTVGDRTASVVPEANFDETDLPGDYSVIYTVTNTAGNYEVTATRIVTIVDTTLPVITLNNAFLGGEGFGRMLIDLNASIDSYYPYPGAPGATASDSFDGDVTASISVDDGDVSDAITEGEPGDYTIRYDVNDTAGNSAESVYRYVTLTGNTETGPVITLTGDSNFTMEVGTTWVEPGYTATKTIGSKTFDYTDDLLVTGSVNAAVVATYTLTYTVQDEYLNESTTTRTVNVVDTTVPSITRTPDANVTHEGGYAYDDPGATAFDEYDGDLTSSIVTTGDDFSVTELGDHNVTYTVKDSSDNVATAVRTVTVVDTTKPIVTLIDSTTGQPYLGLAVEYVDQDPITDPTPTYDDPGFTATDLVDGNVTAIVQITGSVDLNDSAAHVLTYSVTDVSLNVSDPVTRTVYVLDKDNPTIFLDDSDQIVELGSTFLHETATALDNGDSGVPEDLSASVTVTIVKVLPGPSNTVYPEGNQLGVTSAHVSSSRTDVTDISNKGTYEFTYSVSDNAVDADGNPDPNDATQVVRNVVVDDTLPPVIPFIADLIVDEHNDKLNPGTSFRLTDAVSDMTTSFVYDPDGNGSAQFFNLTSTPGSDLSQLTVTLYDLDDNPLHTHTDGKFYESSSAIVEKDIKMEAGDYKIEYQIDDYSGNPSNLFTRDITVRDRTPPTITLIGSSIIHDFFRYDADTDATVNPDFNGSVATTHPATGQTVGLSGHSTGGEHDYVLAPYDFTDPGAYAEDNRDWREADGYPDIDGDDKGEVYFIEDIDDLALPGDATPDRIYRYTQLSTKTLKEYQKGMEVDGDGNASVNVKIPRFEDNSTFAGPHTYNNMQNIVQVTIYYKVIDAAGNQGEATRLVYLYESFKYAGYAFYATPLKDYELNLFEHLHELDSNRTDMDGDGLSDFWEGRIGTDPKNPDSSPDILFMDAVQSATYTNDFDRWQAVVLDTNSTNRSIVNAFLFSP